MSENATGPPPCSVAFNEANTAAIGVKREPRKSLAEIASLRGFQPGAEARGHSATHAPTRIRSLARILARARTHRCNEIAGGLSRRDRRLVHWLHFPSRCVHVHAGSGGSSRPYACIGYARIVVCVRLLTHIRQGARTPLHHVHQRALTHATQESVRAPRVRAMCARAPGARPVGCAASPPPYVCCRT